MGEYVLRVCCCAVVCGVLGSIGGGASGVRKTILGLLLAFTVVAPLRQVHLEEIMELPELSYRKGERIAAEASADARDEILSVISEEVCAYILVEAESLGADINVDEVTLDPETMAPVEVQISGQVSPYIQQRLAEYIRTQLGIGEEHQRWNGET